MQFCKPAGLGQMIRLPRPSLAYAHNTLRFRCRTPSADTRRHAVASLASANHGIVGDPTDRQFGVKNLYQVGAARQLHPRYHRCDGLRHIHCPATSRPSLRLFRNERRPYRAAQPQRHLSTQTESDTTPHDAKKRLDVAIVGAPNAGKSQLINALVGSTVAAVSRKRHTTRGGILGARTVDDTQIVFRDTPGFLRLENAKEERLDRDLIVSAAAEMKHVDFALLVVDAARILNDTYRQALVQLMINAVMSEGRLEDEDDSFLAHHEQTNEQGAAALAEVENDSSSSEDGNNSGDHQSFPATEESDLRPKFAIVLNKVDLVNPKKKLVLMAMELGRIADEVLKYQCPDRLVRIVDSADDAGADNESTPEDQQSQSVRVDDDTLLKIAPVTFYVSAIEKDGTEELFKFLLDMATPAMSWAVDASQSTDMTDEERIREMIHEKIYRCLHREVPHSVRQVNRQLTRTSELIVIHQDLVVETKSHKRLVMGTGGRTMRRIHEAAQRDLEAMFDCKVSLRLHVRHNKSNAGGSIDSHLDATSTQHFDQRKL